MIISRRGSYALGVLAAVALFAGCNSNGGSQVSGLTPSSGTNSANSNSTNLRSRSHRDPSDTFVGVKWIGNVHHDRRKSWVSADVQRAPRLLFVSDDGNDDVDIFTMPDMKLKGTITDFNQPQGECSDKHGNIYVADTQATQVEEFSRTGKLLSAYADSYGYPVGCAVNPVNGNLAVANFVGFKGHGQVLIFSSPSSTPTMLTNPKQYFYSFLGYDIHGDLWVDGRDDTKKYILSDCSGAFACETVSLSGGTIYFPGAVQWDQKEYSWVLFDQRCGNTNAACSYWVSGSGVLGQATNYQNYDGGPLCDMIQGVVAAYGKQYTAGSDYENASCDAGNSSVNRWQYPAGGEPTDYITMPLAKSFQPAGAAISPQNPLQ